MRPELPWAVAEDKSVSIQPARSLFISWGKTVQTNGATSQCLMPEGDIGAVLIGPTIGCSDAAGQYPPLKRSLHLYLTL